MRAESDGEEVEAELVHVRRLLDALVEGRLTHPFSAQQQVEFDRLAERERDALDALAHRRTAANCPDDGRRELT